MLLGAPLSAQRARWLQGLARVDGLREHGGGDTDPVHEFAIRVRVREIADTVAAHALGELHPLFTLGGAAAGAAGAVGAGGALGACAGAAADAGRCARTARADRYDHRDQDKSGQRPSPSMHVFSWG